MFCSLSNIIQNNEKCKNFIVSQNTAHCKNAENYNSNKSTNQIQQFHKFITHVYVWLNVFRVPPCPSSGAYNCISSLWFYRRSMVVEALLGVVWPDHDQQRCYHHAPTVKPEAADAIVSS
jgi:hypothetical protein